VIISERDCQFHTDVMLLTICTVYFIFYSLLYFLGIVHSYQAFLSVIQCLQKVDGLC